MKFDEAFEDVMKSMDKATISYQPGDYMKRLPAKIEELKARLKNAKTPPESLKKTADELARYEKQLKGNI